MTGIQRGIGMIETLGALAIGSLILLGLTAMIDRSMAEMKGQQAAQYQAQIVSAAKKYITAKYADLKIHPAVGATPLPVSIDDLIAANYLQAGFALTNGYQQSTCILIRQPVADKFDALVVTSGGLPIEEKEIAVVAMNAGFGGGYISKETPGTATGSTWKMDTTAYRNVACPGGGIALTGTDSGHLASRIFHDGQAFDDFMARNEVPGMPNLNTMNTPLRMANKAIATRGAACGADAAIAMDAEQNILSCDLTGRWSSISTWKEPVETFAELELLRPTDRPGDVRMVKDIKKAFMLSEGQTKWMALAENENGDLVVTRDMTVAGNTTVTQDLAVEGTVRFFGSVHTNQGLSAGGNIQSGADIHVAGNVYAGQNVTAGGDVNAGRDVKATRNATSTENVIATRDLSAVEGITAEWAKTSTAIIADSFSNTTLDTFSEGMACNIPSTDKFGQFFYQWPYGTLVADTASARPLYCAMDGAFHFVKPLP